MGRYLKSDILFYDMLYFPGVGPLPGSSYQSPWSSSPSLLITAFAEESLELCIGKNIAKSINQSINMYFRIFYKDIVDSFFLSIICTNMQKQAFGYFAYM